MAGRKSLKEEIQVVKYMAELAPKTFKFIGKMLDSEEKADKKWASEQMNKLFSKAVPTESDLTSGGLPIPILTNPNVQPNNSNTEDTGDVTENQSDTRGDISVQDNINPPTPDSTSAV